MSQSSPADFTKEPSCSAVERQGVSFNLTIINQASSTIAIYLVDNRCAANLFINVPQSNTIQLPTFVNFAWVAADPSTGHIIDRFKPLTANAQSWAVGSSNAAPPPIQPSPSPSTIQLSATPFSSTMAVSTATPASLTSTFRESSPSTMIPVPKQTQDPTLLFNMTTPPNLQDGSNTSGSSASDTGIVVGSVVGVLGFIIIAALVFIFRKKFWPPKEIEAKETGAFSSMETLYPVPDKLEKPLPAVVHSTDAYSSNAPLYYYYYT